MEERPPARRDGAVNVAWPVIAGGSAASAFKAARGRLRGRRGRAPARSAIGSRRRRIFEDLRECDHYAAGGVLEGSADKAPASAAAALAAA